MGVVGGLISDVGGVVSLVDPWEISESQVEETQP